MKKFLLFLMLSSLQFGAFSQSVTTLPDGIALGDSVKLSWYGSFSAFRFLSTGETNLGLYFNNKNNYTFSSINNSVDKTDFLSNGKLTLGTGNLFVTRRNSLVIPKNNNDTTAIIQSIGSPYAMLDFRASNNNGFNTYQGQSLGQLYGEQGSNLINTIPSTITLQARERLQLRYSDSFRMWDGTTLRVLHEGDKVKINPAPIPIVGGYYPTLANFDVGGTIRSTNLSGLGKRIVVADKDGILETRNTTEVFSYGISHILPGDEDYFYTIDFSSNLVSLQPNTTAEYLRCPLNLPNGAKIVKIEVKYRENSSTKNLYIQLLGLSNTTNIYHFYRDLLLVNNSSLMQTAIFTPNHIVDNQLASYALIFSVKENGGALTSWPSDQIAIRSVIVTVEY